ncbi:hypothetical protein AB2A46_002927 [Listeria innocua]
MNAARRKRIDQSIEFIIKQTEEVESITEEEQEAIDNIPENLQGSARYGEMEEAISHLEAVIRSLDDALDVLQYELSRRATVPSVKSTKKTLGEIIKEQGLLIKIEEEF